MKECCTNCKYFHQKQVRWVSKYYCPVDGDDRLLGKFDNYTGMATNDARIELERRCCCRFKPFHGSDTLEQRYQQLEQVAKDLLSCVSRWAPRGVYLGFSAELEALGVSLDD